MIDLPVCFRSVVNWSTLLLLSCFICSLGCGPKNQTAEQRISSIVDSSLASPSETPIATSGNSTIAVPQRSDSLQIPIELKVTGFNSSEGMCRVAVYIGPDHFNDANYAIAKMVLPIDGESAAWSTLLTVPPELQNQEKGILLSVSAYHDKNASEKLDKSSFGVPTEAYGFSNNPKRGFGPPKFSETAIAIPLVGTSEEQQAPSQIISIRIK